MQSFFQCNFDVVVSLEIYLYIFICCLKHRKNCDSCWQLILTSWCRRWRLFTFIDIVHIVVRIYLVLKERVGGACWLLLIVFMLLNINCYYLPCFVGRDGGRACWGRWQFRQLSVSKVRVILIVVVIVVVMMLIRTIVAMIVIAVSFRGVTRGQAGKYRWLYLFCIYFGFFQTAW